MSSIRQQISARARFDELVASGEARSIRLRAHLSLRAVADALDLSQSAVVRYELGDRIPRGRTLVRYVRLMEQIERAMSENGRGHDEREAAYG
jgi:transcriptional regulator with XRE-family HTH domain